MQTLDREKIEEKLVLLWKQMCEEYAKIGDSNRDNVYNYNKITTHNFSKTVTIDVLRDKLKKYLKHKITTDDQYLIDDKSGLNVSVDDVGFLRREFKYLRLEHKSDKSTMVLARVLIEVSFDKKEIGSYFNKIDKSVKEVMDLFDTNFKFNLNRYRSRNKLDLVVNIVIHDELVSLLNDKEFEDLYNYPSVCIKNHSLGIVNENLRVLNAQEYKEFMLYKEKTTK